MREGDKHILIHVHTPTSDDDEAALMFVELKSECNDGLRKIGSLHVFFIMRFFSPQKLESKRTLPCPSSVLLLTIICLSLEFWMTAQVLLSFHILSINVVCHLDADL